MREYTLEITSTSGSITGDHPIIFAIGDAASP
jgi:hypothetical protein